MSAGGYHHHLGFNIWRGEGVPPAPAGIVGLRELDVELPAAADVAAVRERLEAAGVPVEPGERGFLVRDPWNMALRVVEAGVMSGPQGPVEPVAGRGAADRPRGPHRPRPPADGRHRPRPGFYVGIMGFDVVFEARDVPGWGTTGDILFVSAGGYHHHLGFNTWKSAGGAAAARRRHGPAPRGAQLLVEGAAGGGRTAAASTRTSRSARLTDHGTHLAIYFSDPDGNDLELAWDRPFGEWPAYGAEDAPAIDAPFDLEELLAAAPR